jgi:hypothetical protein
MSNKPSSSLPPIHFQPHVNNITGEIEYDYYEVLQVTRDANQREVRLAYRRLALIWHPDKHNSANSKDQAMQVFVIISEAYEILSDEEKKQAYDRWGKRGLGGGVEMTPDMAFDLFWDFFQVPYHERGPKPSLRHAAYVTSAGLIVPPVKGVVAGTGAMLAGIGHGTGTVISGSIQGPVDFLKGVGQATGRRKVEEGQPGAMENMSHLVTKPVGGFVKGAAIMTGGAVAGAAIMGTGVVAAGTHVKQGMEEVSDKMYESMPDRFKRNPALTAGTATSAMNGQYSSSQQRQLLLEDHKQIGQSGRSLFKQAMES